MQSGRRIENRRKKLFSISWLADLSWGRTKGKANV